MPRGSFTLVVIESDRAEPAALERRRPLGDVYAVPQRSPAPGGGDWGDDVARSIALKLTTRGLVTPTTLLRVYVTPAVPAGSFERLARSVIAKSGVLWIEIAAGVSPQRWRDSRLVAKRRTLAQALVGAIRIAGADEGWDGTVAAPLAHSTWCIPSPDENDPYPLITRGGAAGCSPWQYCGEWQLLLTAAEVRSSLDRLFASQAAIRGAICFNAV